MEIAKPDGVFSSRQSRSNPVETRHFCGILVAQKGGVEETPATKAHPRPVWN
jgi:hypothetical protein